jgi:hypothetical protein
LSTPDPSQPNQPDTEVDDPQDLSVLGFKLAPLQHLDPAQLLCGDDDVDAFVLAMALAYNDIKSAQWVFYMLQRHRPPDVNAIKPDVGEWLGMRVHMTRWLMALAHEVLDAVASADKKGVLKKGAIRAALQTLPVQHRRLWRELVKTATPQGRAASRTTIRPFLRDIRNYGVFHFAYSEELLKAYRAYFLSDPKRASNARAFISVGDTMAKTRFYFADAAAQRMYSGTADLDVQFRRAEAFLNDLHHTLTGFVWGYLKHRVEEGERVSPRGLGTMDSG